MTAEVRHGEATEVLRSLPAESFDACVTDPPYGLRFMGRKWDYDVPSVEPWQAVLRVLKPGAHVVAFGGPRTYHRLACNIEDAGFEIRDQIQWIFGSGYPKAKGLLKPAHEPIVLARKPLDGTLARNMAMWGGGALSTEACRLAYASDADKAKAKVQGRATSTRNAGARPRAGAKLERRAYDVGEQKGRWPANVIIGCACEGDEHDPECAVRLLDEQSGVLHSRGTQGKPINRSAQTARNTCGRHHGGKGDPVPSDVGGASRFFYCAKASNEDRGHFNTHPTVKPVALMRYLVRLVCPPGGRVLDPFAGSGTTLVACNREERSALGIEREADFVAIAEKRLAQGELFAAGSP